MRLRTVGYIVMQEDKPMAEQAGDGVLCFGPSATLFPNRESVRKAIARSNKYSRQEGLDWLTDHSIVRLVEQERGNEG